MIKTVFSAVVALVELAELLMGAGNGEQKKASVVDAIKAFFAAAGINTEILDKAVGPLIDFVVFVYNWVGRFKKTRPPDEVAAH